MATEQKGVIKSLLSIGIIQVANYVFPMITIPVVARAIGPDKLGEINFSSSYVAYFVLLITFGFNMTATRKVAADPNNVANRSEVFSEVFTSQCLLLLFSTVLFTVTLLFVPNLHENVPLYTFTFLTCIATVLTQNWLFQAMRDLPKVAVLNLISKVAFTIAILLMVHEKDDYLIYPLALSLSQVLMAIASFSWSIKRYKLQFHFVSLRRCLLLLWNSKVYFFSLCVINLYTNTNIIILGILKSKVDVGLYTSGQKIINIVQMLITIPFSQVLFPVIGKAFGENYEKGIAIVQKILPVVLILTFLAGFLILLTAPYIISILYGEHFYPAVEVCRVLAFIPMIISISILWGIHVMLNLRMDRIFFKITLIGAIVSLILNTLLVEQLGFIGAAYTWMITESLNLTMMYVVLRSRGIPLIGLKYFSFKNLYAFLRPIEGPLRGKFKFLS